MFSIVYSGRFERSFKTLLRVNRKLVNVPKIIEPILSFDPYNISRQFKIKKLSDIRAGDGQWRLRIGDYRIRYDIEDKKVILYSIKHRRDAY